MSTCTGFDYRGRGGEERVDIQVLFLVQIGPCIVFNIWHSYHASVEL